MSQDMAPDGKPTDEDILSKMQGGRTDAEVAEYFAAIGAPPQQSKEIPFVVETDIESELRHTKEDLNAISRKYISEEMLQTVAGAMGEHRAPGLLYLGSDGKVTRVDWERLDDEREVELLLALLRVTAGRYLPHNKPSSPYLANRDRTIEKWLGGEV